MKDYSPNDLATEIGYGESIPECEPLEFDVNCPSLVLVGNDPKKLNWTRDQCCLRIEKNDKCTKNCPVAEEIRQLRVERRKRKR